MAASSCQYAIAIGQESEMAQKAILKISAESTHYNRQVCLWAKEKIVPRIQNFAFHINLRNQKGKGQIRDREFQDFTFRAYQLTKEILKSSCDIKETYGDSKLQDAFRKLSYHSRYIKREKCSSVKRIYSSGPKNKQDETPSKSGLEVGLEILNRIR